jgi:uncharacterized protein
VDDLMLGEFFRAYSQYGLAGLLARIIPCRASVSLYGFDPFGAVYPCWDVMGNPKERIGSYSGDGIVLTKRAAEWRARSLANMPACIGCKYVFFHRGGCAAHPLPFGGTPCSARCVGYEDVFMSVTRTFCLEGKFEKEFCAASELGEPMVSPALC